MDQIMAFVQEQWFIVIMAVILFFIVVKVAKTVIKWIVILAIIAGLLIYGANYTL